MKNPIKRSYAELTSLIGYTFPYGINELVQALNQTPPYYPTIFKNHLSNFAGGAMWTSLSLMISENSKFNGKYRRKLARFASVALPATLGTIEEIVPFIGYVRDPYDAVAVWFGSIAAYLGIKLLEKLSIVKSDSK
jgi:hypothetical protein